jgi:hypothetical protein
VVTRAGTPFTPRRSSGSPDQAGHRALRASEGPRQPPCAVRRAPLPKAAGGATNPATDPRSGQRRHGPGVERPPPSPFERQPDPRATTAATSDHARRASPWCRCRSPCAVRRCRRQPEARRTRPPTPARGSGATAPVWSDRRRRPFERQPGPRAAIAATSDHARRASPWCRCRSPCAVRRCRRQPEARRTRPPTPARGSGATAPVWSDHRRRPFERQPDPRATIAATSDHARRASPWCRCRSPFAVRRCRRQPKARRTRPPTPARGSGATAPVWSDHRRRRSSGSPIPERPSPPRATTPVERRPGAVVVRRSPCAAAEGSRRRDEPGHRLPLGAAAPRPPVWSDHRRRRSSGSPIPERPSPPRATTPVERRPGAVVVRRAPCAVRRCRRQPEARRTRPPTPARGSGATAPVWSDRRRRRSSGSPISERPSPPRATTPVERRPEAVAPHRISTSTNSGNTAPRSPSASTASTTRRTLRVGMRDTI